MLFPSEFTLTASGDITAREWEALGPTAGIVPGFSPLHGADAPEPGHGNVRTLTGRLARAAGAVARRAARERECRHALPAHPPQIRARVGGYDGTITMWDMATGRPIPLG